jgi:hypothetical protein
MDKIKHYYRCAINSCDSSTVNNSVCKFIAFPKKNAKKYNKWVEVTGLQIISANKFVCSKHFFEDDFSTDGRIKLESFPRKNLDKRSIDALFVNNDQLVVNPPAKKIHKDTFKTYSNSSQCFSQNQSNVNLKLSELTKTIEKRASKTNYQMCIEPSILDPKFKSDELKNKTEMECLELQIKRLKKDVINLKHKNKRLMKNNKKISISVFINKLKHVNQVPKTFCKMLLNQRHKNKMWSRDERCLAHMLHSKSPNLYGYMRGLGFNLPSTQSLKNWLPVQDFKPGFQESTIVNIKDMLSKQDDKSQYALLSFDGIKTRAEIQYNPRKDLIEGVCDDGIVRKNEFAKEICTFMLRGTFGSWRSYLGHTIYNNITGVEAKSQLLRALDASDKSGAKVIATVCDQGSSNRLCYSLLGKSLNFFRSDL